MFAPPPPPRPRPPPMCYERAALPDGRSGTRLGWWENGVFRWREVDQYVHPIHLGTPIDKVWWSGCFPRDCRPLPPGAMPRPRPMEEPQP